MDVNLNYNKMTYIDLTEVEDWAAKHRPRHVFISIKKNPIQCDCRLYDFLRYQEGRLQPYVNETLRLEIGKVKCHNQSDFRETLITDLRSKTLKCNFNERDSEFECPDKCNCYLHPENKSFIVNCAYKDSVEAPRKLEYPLDPRIDHIELNLTGNYLTKMPDLQKNGYNNITILTLDHKEISNVTVDGLSNKLKVRKIKSLK